MFRIVCIAVAAMVLVACGNGPTESVMEPAAPVAPTPPTPPPAAAGACRVGQELSPGQSCTFGSSTFSVRDDGYGCIGSSICAGQGLTINQFQAQRITGTSRWRIVRLP